MNDRIAPSVFSSLDDDEEQIRHHPPSLRSLDSLRDSLTPSAAALFDALISVFRPPKSGSGVVAACDELLADIDLLIKSEGLVIWGPWRVALHDLLSELQMKDRPSPALDRASTMGLNLGSMLLLLARPTLPDVFFALVTQKWRHRFPRGVCSASSVILSS